LDLLNSLQCSAHFLREKAALRPVLELEPDPELVQEPTLLLAA